MRPSPRPAVLYSFLESRCHLSELECRRMQGGLLSPVGGRAGHPRAALICAGTNPAVILSTSTMLQRLRDSVARSVIIGKGMTSARLFFGLQGHSTEGVKVPLSLSLSLSGSCSFYPSFLLIKDLVSSWLPFEANANADT